MHIFDSSGNMGYDRSRFEGDVDEEFICTICLGVLQEPLQVHPFTCIVWQFKNFLDD